MVKRFHFVLTVLLLASGISACDSGGSSSGLDPEADTRFINAVPDSPPILFRLQEGPTATVSFGQASNLFRISNGNDELDVSYFEPDGDEIDLIEDETISYARESEVSLVLTGPLESTQLIELENSEADVESGVEVQFVNATAVEAVEIYLVRGSANLNGQSPLAALAPNETSDIVNLDAGDDYFVVATDGDSGSVIYQAGPTRLQALTRRLFVAIDYFGPGGGVMRVVQVDTNSASTLSNEALPSEFRIANMAPDLADLDVYVNDTLTAPISSNVSFARLSGYSELLPDTYEFIVTFPGDPATVVFSDDVTLVPGESRTMVLSGQVGDASLRARFVRDDNRRVGISAQVRVVHAAPSAESVDVYFLVPGEQVDDSVSVFSNFVLLANGVVALDGGDYDVVFTREGEETILFGPERISVSPGGIYGVYLTDAPGGGTPIDITLTDDFQAAN